MKNLDIFLAVIGGAAVGACAGMLLAPKKGKDTREDIIEYIKEKFPSLKRNKLEALADRIAEEIKEA